MTIPTIKVREYPDGSLAVFHGPRRIIVRGKAEVPLGGPHQILDTRIVRRASCRDRRVGCETREKVHNRRRSCIRRARKLVRKKMQREGLLPMKPRVAPEKGGPARSSIVEEGS
jgi:hypothetical protein